MVFMHNLSDSIILLSFVSQPWSLQCFQDSCSLFRTCFAHSLHQTLPLIKEQISSLKAALLLGTLAVATPQTTGPSGAVCWLKSGLTPSLLTSCPDYDTSTNYYTDGPDTGVTREYWFEITNTTLAPDGIDRIVLAVNGSFPGPTIIADW